MNGALEEWKHRALESEAEVERLRNLQRGVTQYECKHCKPDACPWVAELREERDRYKAALASLLDALERYSYGSLGDAEDEAREALGDE